MRELLRLLAEHYQEGVSEKAQVRTLQNDLKFLRDAQDIICDPKTGERATLRYRRAQQEWGPTGNVNLDNLYDDLVQRGIAPDLVRDFVQRVQHPRSYYDLPPEQFVAVADSVRLMPKHRLDTTVQDEILQALQQGRVLKASYRKPDMPQHEERFLHPLGVLLRGPQHYLIAYDAKDLGRTAPPPAKMFLIHRLEDVLMLEDSPSQLPAGASVAQLVREQGLADFVRDTEPVTLKLRVWDYVLRLLEDHQIAPNQTFQREADGDSAIVTARIMQSGTLYRWLLGFGDKVEVLEPASLRHAIAWQASNLTDYYEDVYEAAEEEESKDDGT